MKTPCLVLFLTVIFVSITSHAKVRFEGENCIQNDSSKKVTCPQLKKELKSGKNALVLDMDGNCWRKANSENWRYSWCPRKKGTLEGEVSKQERWALLNYLCESNGFLEEFIKENQEPGAVTKANADEVSCGLETLINQTLYGNDEGRFCDAGLLSKAKAHCDVELTLVKATCNSTQDKQVKMLDDLRKDSIKIINLNKK